MNKRAAGSTHLTPDDLIVDQVYLMISYFDDAASIPEVVTVVYLGRDVLGERTQKHYFQEYAEYSERSATRRSVIEAPDEGLMNFFTLKGGADVLLECARARGM